MARLLRRPAQRLNDEKVRSMLTAMIRMLVPSGETSIESVGPAAH
jgi:hypothetical protein